MKFLCKAKDGGPESPVDAYFVIEWKKVFSIAFLKFKKGSREAYHSHAFNAYTWFLVGDMMEERLIGANVFLRKYKRRFLPKYTPRENLHRVKAFKDSWCLTIRGPWKTNWQEWDEKTETLTTFGHGRKIVSQNKNTGE